jgi:hypothetical protein
MMIKYLNKKPSVFVLGTYIALTCMQYFFRNGYKNDLSTIKFGAAFLGFPHYQFFLHGFLTLTAFYSSHVIPFMLMPLYITGDLSQSSSSMKHNLLPRFALTIVLVQSYYNVSVTLMSGILRYGRFALALAPACVFNWFHITLFFSIAIILLIASQKPKED